MAVLLRAAGARMQAASNEEGAVRAVVAEEIEAWRTHGAKKVAALYTVDGKFQDA